MEHKEILRLVPEADTAVLLIHGIVGTPNHFITRIPLMQQVPENWSMHNLLLAGHGGNVDDFSKASMNLWRRQAIDAFEALAAEHEQVVVVGHSMGTLFSMQLALRYPEKIPFLFLLGVPLRPGVRPSAAVRCLRIAFGKVRLDHILETAMEDACGVRTSPLLWKYLGWVPRFLELFREIACTERMIRNLKVPAVAYQSRRDELVTNFSWNALKRAGFENLVSLPNSTHFYYDPEEMDEILRDFSSRCEAIKKKKA